MADAPTIIRMILYLPGQMAKRVVAQASEIFMRFLSGDATLVQDVMRSRELQQALRRKDPDHWARLFGEHAEQAESSAAAQTGAHVAPDNAALRELQIQNASNELQRIQERYDDRSPIWRPVNFADSRGRMDPNRQTPVADAQNIIKIILLLPGEQAARIRTKASEVFVRFLVRPGLT